MTKEIDWGSHIDSACELAVKEAKKTNREVEFDFNGTKVIAHPGDSPQQLSAKWQTDFNAAAKAMRESPEYIARETARLKRESQERAETMEELSTTEEEMRDTKTPWPLTKKQLNEYTDSLLNRSHDYGTCVYAMSLAAMAAFNFVAGQLGVTGFQASCADLDFLRRSRSIDGPFMIIKAEDALYPQSDVQEKFRTSFAGWQPWLQEKAKIKLLEVGQAHPAVRKHWENLAAGKSIISSR